MKGKIVLYECSWPLCKTKVPKSQVQDQINMCRALGINCIIRCPNCGSPMVRRTIKEK